jgi:hypothetical protein
VCHLTESEPTNFQAVNLAGPKILLRDLLAELKSLTAGAYSFQPFPEEIKALDCGDGELDQQRLEKLWPGFEFTELRPALETTCAYFTKELS